MSARVAEPVPEPRAQAPRLADVEQAAVLPEQMVHPGRRRNLGETLARHVHDERLAVARRMLQRQQLAHARDAALGGPLEEHAQDLRRDAGIAEAAVAVVAGEPERRGDGVERATPLLRQQPACETDGAEGGTRERPPGDRAMRRIQMRDVEAGVVGDQHGVACELEEPRQHLGDRRRGGHHRVGDPRERRDERLDRTAGIHQRAERVEQAPVDHAHGADLDDATAGGAAPRRLEVDDHEGLPRDRPAEEIVRTRVPATSVDVEAEARVAAEQHVEEAGAELRIATLAREDQREQVRWLRSVGPIEQVFEETLPHRRRRPSPSSEGPERPPLDGGAGRARARGDAADVLLEAGQLLALPLLELVELALPLGVEALEGVASSARGSARARRPRRAPC